MWHCAVQFLKKWTCRNLSRTRHVFDSESHASSLTLSPAVHVECHTVHVLRDLNCLCWNVPSSVSVTDGSAPPLPLHTMTCAPSATPTSVHGLFNGVYACSASGRLLKRERGGEKMNLHMLTWCCVYVHCGMWATIGVYEIGNIVAIPQSHYPRCCCCCWCCWCVTKVCLPTPLHGKYN